MQQSRPHDLPAPRRILVVGGGYVGLSNAVMLSTRHDVTVLDIAPERVQAINRRQAYLSDAGIADWLASRPLRLRATGDADAAHADADLVIIATPSDLAPGTGQLDTSHVEGAVRTALAHLPGVPIVVKSTVPVGFTDGLRRATGSGDIIFSPEFLREGMALEDCLAPSRVVVGERSARGQEIAALFGACGTQDDVPVCLTGNAEAEAIKLLANAYLATRVAFFNEADTLAASRGLDAAEIIRAVCMDPRIGDHYNNPSFGYGGYCLPKDTRQLRASAGDLPQALFGAVIDANERRKDFIAQQVLARRPATVGVHRLVMKAGSDNFRSSSVRDVMERLRAAGVDVIVHEPLLDAGAIDGCRVVNDIAAFKAAADVILANRRDPALADVRGKVYSRDAFGSDR
jgi:UDPglucose 6-dehydrogenase